VVGVVYEHSFGVSMHENMDCILYICMTELKITKKESNVGSTQCICFELD